MTKKRPFHKYNICDALFCNFRFMKQLNIEPSRRRVQPLIASEGEVNIEVSCHFKSRRTHTNNLQLILYLCSSYLDRYLLLRLLQVYYIFYYILYYYYIFVVIAKAKIKSRLFDYCSKHCSICSYQCKLLFVFLLIQNNVAIMYSYANRTAYKCININVSIFQLLITSLQRIQIFFSIFQYFR